MKIDIYNNEGQKTTTQNINDDVFHIVLNKQAAFDSVLAENAALRQGTHSTKTKAEVSGGGKKPWAQKGTGNARQGSTRSPQWRHGGVVFGPKPTRNYTLKVNKKVHKLAMASVLSDKFINNNVKVVDNFTFNEFSLKNALKFISSFTDTNKKILIIDSKFNEFLSKSLNNTGKISYLMSNQVSPKDIMHNDFILLDVDTLNHYNEVYK